MNWSTLVYVKADFWYHMWCRHGNYALDIRQVMVLGKWILFLLTDNLDVWQLQSISVFDPTM